MAVKKSKTPRPQYRYIANKKELTNKVFDAATVKVQLKISAIDKYIFQGAKGLTYAKTYFLPEISAMAANAIAKKVSDPNYQYVPYSLRMRELKNKKGETLTDKNGNTLYSKYQKKVSRVKQIRKRNVYSDTDYVTVRDKNNNPVRYKYNTKNKDSYRTSEHFKGEVKKRRKIIHRAGSIYYAKRTTYRPFSTKEHMSETVDLIKYHGKSARYAITYTSPYAGYQWVGPNTWKRDKRVHKKAQNYWLSPYLEPDTIEFAELIRGLRKDILATFKE